MIGDLERKHGDRNEALAATQKAYKIFEHLLAENPQQASYRRNLSQSFNNLGRLQAQTGDSAIALRSFQRAIDLYESLHELSAKDSYNLACNIALCIPRSPGRPHCKASRKSRARAIACGVNSTEIEHSNAATIVQRGIPHLTDPPG